MHGNCHASGFRSCPLLSVMYRSGIPHLDQLNLTPICYFPLSLFRPKRKRQRQRLKRWKRYTRKKAVRFDHARRVYIYIYISYHDATSACYSCLACPSCQILVQPSCSSSFYPWPKKSTRHIYVCVPWPFDSDSDHNPTAVTFD